MSKWLVIRTDEYGDKDLEFFVTEDAAMAEAERLASAAYTDVTIWRRHASAKSRVVVEIEKED